MKKLAICLAMLSAVTFSTNLSAAEVGTAAKESSSSATVQNWTVGIISLAAIATMVGLIMASKCHTSHS